MLSQDVVDELTDFDLQHFCDGNPIYCYYFRLPQTKVARQLDEPLKEATCQSPLHQQTTMENTTASVDDVLRHISYRDPIDA